jgi:hypothetical protein
MEIPVQCNLETSAEVHAGQGASDSDATPFVASSIKYILHKGEGVG